MLYWLPEGREAVLSHWGFLLPAKSRFESIFCPPGSLPLFWLVGDTCPPAAHRTWVRDTLLRQPGSDESGGSVVGTWAAMNAAPGAIWLPAGPQPAAYSHCQKAHYGVGNQHSPGRHQFDASSRRVLSIAATLDI